MVGRWDWQAPTGYWDKYFLLSTIVSNGSKQEGGGGRWSQGGATVTIGVLWCWLTASNDSDLSLRYTAKQDMYLSNSVVAATRSKQSRHRTRFAFHNLLLISPFIGRIYIIVVFSEYDGNKILSVVSTIFCVETKFCNNNVKPSLWMRNCGQIAELLTWCVLIIFKAVIFMKLDN